VIGLHGSFVEVFGIGLFIKGKSGIGKTTLLLKLLNRGHFFVSDDLVIFKKDNFSRVIAFNNGRFIAHLRNFGFIDIIKTYGIKAVKDSSILNLIVELRQDEFLLEEEEEILNVKFKKVILNPNVDIENLENYIKIFKTEIYDRVY
jgi:serine kinase of HPr protein (carbohydrate metabolism regulator)